MQTCTPNLSYLTSLHNVWFYKFLTFYHSTKKVNPNAKRLFFKQVRTKKGGKMVGYQAVKQDNFKTHTG